MRQKKNAEPTTTYQLSEESCLFRFLFVSLILIQIVLQFQRQCVIISTNDFQNLKKTRTQKSMVWKFYARPLTHEDHFRQKHLTSLFCSHKSKSGEEYVLYLLFCEWRQVVGCSPLVDLGCEVVDNSPDVHQGVRQPDGRLLPLTITRRVPQSFKQRKKRIDNPNPFLSFFFFFFFLCNQDAKHKRRCISFSENVASTGHQTRPEDRENSPIEYRLSNTWCIRINS